MRIAPLPVRPTLDARIFRALLCAIGVTLTIVDSALVFAGLAHAQVPTPPRAPATQNEDVRVRQAPNSRVALKLPPSFQAARLYSGFEDERRGISFVIFEAPRAAYDEMKAAFTPETLAARGLTDGRSGTLARTGDYIYMRARQSSPAGRYAKFFVLFRAFDQTVLVSANVPDTSIETGSIKIKEIEAVLASAHTVALADIKDLYKFGYLGPFKEAGRVAGTSKLYTLDGQLEAQRKGLARPALIIAPSIDKRPIIDIEVTARSLLQTLAGYRDISVGVPERVDISGLKGVALTGHAVDAESGAAIVIYQVLLSGSDGGYYRIVGLLPKDDADQLMAEVVRIALSFEVLPG